MPFVLPRYHAPDFSAPPLMNAPEVSLSRAPADFVAPEGYHASTIFPEYIKKNGTWHLAEDSRMDCVLIWEDNRVHVREFRHIRAGDWVVLGRTEDGVEGIYVHANGFPVHVAHSEPESFAFRQGRSRETAFSAEYDTLYRLLRHEHAHGNIVWVLGPACVFDSDAREAMCKLIQNGYVSALLAGNALATHDLEGALLHTALGQDIYTQCSLPEGHYNHIDVLNRVRSHGSISAFIKGEGIDDGVMYHCTRAGVPYVLAGSIRDDGPLPEVYSDVYAAQDAMRSHIRRATTVICLATTLHTIATGNMTPSFRVLPDGTVRPVYFYTVDVSEFATNKLSDRGSLSAKSVVANVQDFLVLLSRGLGL